MHLKFNNELLKGIEIIDTPGLGDPLSSRSLQTKKFLVHCDAVFLLSFSSQFLKDTDMKLIIERFPDDGICQLELVGTKFDSVILDERPRGGQKENIRKVFLRCGTKLTERTIENIKKELQNAQTRRAKDLLQRLLESIDSSVKQNKIGYFTSSLLYSAAVNKESGREFSENEAHVINELKRFDGIMDTPNFLKSFSFIPKFKENEFEKLRKIKQQIINERTEQLYQGQIDVLVDILSSIQAEAEAYRKHLAHDDMDQIRENLEKNQDAARCMRRDISMEFKKCALDTHNFLVDVANRIKSETTGGFDVKIVEEKHTIHHKTTTGFWIFKKENHYNEDVTDSVVSLSAVEKGIMDLVIRIEKNMRMILM